MPAHWFWDFGCTSFCLLLLATVHFSQFYDHKFCKQGGTHQHLGTLAVVSTGPPQLLGLTTQPFSQFKSPYPCHASSVAKAWFLVKEPIQLARLLLSADAQDADHTWYAPLLFLYGPLCALPHLAVKVQQLLLRLPTTVTPRWVSVYHQWLRATLSFCTTGVRRLWLLLLLQLRPQWPLPASVELQLGGAPLVGLCSSALFLVPTPLQAVICLLDSIAFTGVCITLSKQQRWPYGCAPLGPTASCLLNATCCALAVTLRWRQQTHATSVASRVAATKDPAKLSAADDAADPNCSQLPGSPCSSAPNSSRSADAICNLGSPDVVQQGLEMLPLQLALECMQQQPSAALPVLSYRYCPALRHRRFAVKVPWAHLSDLPPNWQHVLQNHLLASSELLVSAVAREGCIELTLHLARNGDDSHPQPAELQVSELASLLESALPALLAPQQPTETRAPLYVWLNGQCFAATHNADSHTWKVQQCSPEQAAKELGQQLPQTEELDTDGASSASWQVWPPILSTQSPASPVRLLLYCSHTHADQDVTVKAHCGSELLPCQVESVDSWQMQNDDVQLSDLSSASGAVLCVCIPDVPACGLLQLEVWQGSSCRQLLPVALLSNVAAATELQVLLGGWPAFCQACTTGVPAVPVPPELLLDLGFWVQYSAQRIDASGSHRGTAGLSMAAAIANQPVAVGVAAQLLGSCLSWGCCAAARYILDGFLGQGHSFQVAVQAVAAAHGLNMLQLAQRSGSDATVQTVLAWGQQFGYYSWASSRTVVATDAVEAPVGSNDPAKPPLSPTISNASLAAASGSSSRSSRHGANGHAHHSAGSALLQAEAPLATWGALMRACFTGFSSAAMEQEYVRFVGSKRFSTHLFIGAIINGTSALAAVPHMHVLHGFDVLLIVLINLAASLLACAVPGWLSRHWEHSSLVFQLMRCAWMVVTGVRGSVGAVGGRLQGVVVATLYWMWMSLWQQVRVRTSVRVFLPLEALAMAAWMVRDDWFGRSPAVLGALLLHSAVLLGAQVVQECGHRRAFLWERQRKDK